MLKLWFPHIPVQPVSAPPGNTTFLSGSLQDTSSPVPPHKHRDQLHIPVKVRFSSILRRFHTFFYRVLHSPPFQLTPVFLF